MKVAFLHTLHMSKPVITFVFKVLRKDCLRPYFTHVQTCDNVRVQSATKRNVFSYCTHVQNCDNVRVQSVTKRTAFVHTVHTVHMSKPVITFVFKLLRTGLPSSYFTQAQTCDNVRVQTAIGRDCFRLYFTQACDNVRVQTAMEGTAFVHTSRMPKAVITFLFQRQPRNTVYSFKLKTDISGVPGQRPHNRTGKVVALSKNLFHGIAQAAANLKMSALVLQGVLKNKERPRRKGPLPSQSLNPRKKLWVWKARLRCWKRMAIKAWPKGDRKGFCHRFSKCSIWLQRAWGWEAFGWSGTGHPKYRFWKLLWQEAWRWRRTTSTGLPDCQVRDTRWQRMGALTVFKLFGSAESTSKATPSKASLKSRWMMQRWKGGACWKRMGPPKHWLMLHLPQVKMMLSLAMRRPSPKRSTKKTSRG